MPLYDLMLLLDPGVPSDRQDTILRDVQGLLESGGTLVGTHDWGMRRMTFEIDHRPDAAYHLFQFEAEGGGALLERVDHSLKIMDGVLRHRIIRLKDGSPPPPSPAPDRRGGYGDYESGRAEVPAAQDPGPEAGTGEARGPPPLRPRPASRARVRRGRTRPRAASPPAHLPPPAPRRRSSRPHRPTHLRPHPLRRPRRRT